MNILKYPTFNNTPTKLNPMLKREILCAFMLSLASFKFAAAQQVTLSPEQIQQITPEWKGERTPDGRPHVADKWLDRLKNVRLEEAWGILRNKGYNNQFESEWMLVHENAVMTGRAVTAQYMHARTDYDKLIKYKGKTEGRIGALNSWPIDVLKNGDIYVADSYGKVIDGTLIGDNLGNSIYAHSQRGFIFYGSVRDIEGLEEIEGFNGWMKGYDPSYIQQMMLTGINTPVRIGRASVLPGDVVLAKKGGVIFIPAHLVEEVVVNAEFIALRDNFGHQRLREGKYTPGQIDTQWTEEIKKDFLKWIDEDPKRLPMTREELNKFMKERNW